MNNSSVDQQQLLNEFFKHNENGVHIYSLKIAKSKKSQKNKKLEPKKLIITS